VNFIKYNPGIPDAKGSGPGLKKTAVGQISLARGNLIPVKIEGRASSFPQPSFSQQGLSYLPWSGQKNHVSAGKTFVKGIVFDDPGDIFI